MEARPLAAYIRSKVGDSWARARSTMGLMRRMGWPWGTKASGVTTVNMVVCGNALPRMSYLFTEDGPSPPLNFPITVIFNTLLGHLPHRLQALNGEIPALGSWSRNSVLVPKESNFLNGLV